MVRPVKVVSKRDGKPRVSTTASAVQPSALRASSQERNAPSMEVAPTHQ